MVFVSVEERIGGCGLRRLFARIVIVLRNARQLIDMSERCGFKNCEVVETCRVVVPRVVNRFFPGVEWGGDSRLSAIPMSAVAGAYLGKHEKFGFAHFLCYFEECIVERLVENQARHVSPGVNTEAIDTHFDEFAVGLDDVVEHSRIFGV